MKHLFICILLFGLYMPANAGEQHLESYISNFDYEARSEMKMDSKRLIKLLMEGKAQLIDIRFQEEYTAWKIGASINIPLNLNKSVEPTANAQCTESTILSRTF